MKKLIFIIIGLTISISVMAEVHGVNLLAQSPTVTPSPFVTDKTGKASESKGNVLPHNQRGSNSNLKRGQRTPLPSYKSQINQTQVNNPYNRGLDNQNYNNNPGSESKGNVLPHNQRGSNSNLKRSQRTPLPSYKSQINQTQANNPYNRSLDNQNYNNNLGFESKGNVLPHNQQGSNSNLKRGQHTPLSTNQPRANSPYSGSLINQNYSNNPGPKRGRNIFTGRDQSKLNQGNARPRSHRD